MLGLKLTHVSKRSQMCHYNGLDVADMLNILFDLNIEMPMTTKFASWQLGV